MEVAILSLFPSLWAMAIGILQGEGFVGEHGKHGMARIADRPLLVGMFVLVLGLYEILADLLTVLTSEALGADKSLPTAGRWMTLSGLIGGYRTILVSGGAFIFLSGCCTMVLIGRSRPRH